MTILHKEVKKDKKRLVSSTSIEQYIAVGLLHSFPINEDGFVSLIYLLLTIYCVTCVATHIQCIQNDYSKLISNTLNKKGDI
jgi:hypothetical protein